MVRRRMEFDRTLGVHRARLHDAIDRLRANALGSSGDADDYERHGAADSSTPTTLGAPPP